MQVANPELIDEGFGYPGIESHAVLRFRVRAPFGQPAPDRVRADDAVPIGQIRCEEVHVAPGARQAVPCQDCFRVACAPEGEMDLAAGADEVTGFEFHGAEESAFRPAAFWRNRPTMPSGK